MTDTLDNIDAFLREHGTSRAEERARFLAGNRATFDVDSNGVAVIKRPGRTLPGTQRLFCSDPLTKEQRMHYRILRDMGLSVGQARRLGFDV